MRVVAFVCAAMLSAGSAGAATMTAVFTGTVFNSFDWYGTFSGTGSSGTLDGQAFTLTFVYDPNLGSRTRGPGIDTITVPDERDAVSPILSTTLTINEISRVFADPGPGRISQYITQFGFIPGTSYGAAEYSVAQDFSSSQSEAGIRAGGSDLVLPYNLDQSFGPLDLSTASDVFGGFNFLDIDASGSYSVFANGRFTPESLTVTGGDPVPVPVPLPATGALLLMAAGAIVAATRRKRRHG